MDSMSKFFEEAKPTNTDMDTSIDSALSGQGCISGDLEMSFDSKSHDSEQFSGGQTKIHLMNDFIGGGNFPFGAEIDSETTELSLNRLRVISMAKILYERTLEKIPGNSQEAIEEVVLRFGHYVNQFGNVPTKSDISNDHLSLRLHVFFFLHQLFFYVVKAESVNLEQEILESGGRRQSYDDTDI